MSEVLAFLIIWQHHLIMQKGEYVHRVQTAHTAEGGENLPYTQQVKIFTEILTLSVVVMSFYNPYILP